MISIIIPVYNGETFITKTVRRILRSTYTDLEVLLVDDGSTDHSPALCDKLANADRRVKAYHKENGGVDSARNYGIDAAQGEVLCFCDQDDIVEPECYERLWASYRNSGSDIVMCSSGRSVDGKRSDYEVQTDSVYEGFRIQDELLVPLLVNGFQLPCSPEFPFTASGKQTPDSNQGKTDSGQRNRYPHIWNCMFRTEFIREHHIRFRTYVNYEDDLLFKVEALSKADKVSSIAYTGYYWRVNLKSETYAHHYVKEIGKKQDAVWKDIENSISGCIQDETILDQVKQVTFCKQYLDAVHNLTSPEIRKRKGFHKLYAIRNYYNKNIYSREYKHCIEAGRYVKKGRVKPGILLPLLAMRMTVLSYLAEKVLDRILLISLHSDQLVKLERWIKK